MNWRKLGLIVGICALLLVLGGFGAYQYLINHYSSQIDLILADLLDDHREDAPTSGTEDQVTEHPSTEPLATDPNPPATPQSRPETGSSSEGSKPNSSQTPEPGGTSPANVVDKATANLNLSAEERDKAESADEILEQMSTSEKLMVLKTLNRFSTSELLEMYRIYSGGDAEAIAELKKAIKAKFSAEDIELIKQMAAKYR